MEILRTDPDHALWAEYAAHLRHTNQARWVLGDDDQPTEPFWFLGAAEDGQVVGNLALKEQGISMPATEWSGGVDKPLLDAEGVPVRETFVMTFFVEAPHRRRGIGRALQEAAVAWTRERGCLQMRSWSSLDRPENYAMKLSMGFAMHPSVHDAAGGFQVSGVYFVKRVDREVSESRHPGA